MDKCCNDFDVAVHMPGSLAAVPTTLLYMVNLRSDASVDSMLLRNLEVVTLVGTDRLDCGSFSDMRHRVEENSAREQYRAAD